MCFQRRMFVRAHETNNSVGNLLLHSRMCGSGLFREWWEARQPAATAGVFGTQPDS
jgi:hypothetical protein